MKKEGIQRVLQEHLHANVTTNTLTALGNFLILWGVFEKRYFSHPYPGGHEGYNVKFNLSIVRSNQNIIIRDLEKPVEYFRKRYLLDIKEGDARFNSLEISGNLKGEVLLGLKEAATNSEKRISLFIIMYALRNNLFHGKKEPQVFNDNRGNFDIINEVLVDILTV